jgi:hypothetical protein
MKRFISACLPGYVGPHRITVRAHLTKLYLQMRLDLVKYFKTVSKISLTCDLWKATTLHHYLTLTAHWFDKSFIYRSTVLAFRILMERHIEENLRSVIEFELENFEIDKSKIASITTDNARDIKKAAHDGGFGKSLGCISHILNLIVQNGLALWSTER